MDEDFQYRVRHRAYELWDAAGRPDNKHSEFWEAAEKELKVKSEPPKLGETVGITAAATQA